MFNATGHLSRSVFEVVGVPRDAEVYICGPTRFMEEMKEALATLGVMPDRMHVEIFNGSESMMPGVVGTAPPTPHLPANDPETGVLVSFARSGIAAHWKGSSYQSILELAEACDVPVRWSCRTGVCHNCETGLVSGAVVYAPEPLDKPADGQSARVLLTTASRHRHRFVTSAARGGGARWRVSISKISNRLCRGESIGIIPPGYSRHSLEDQRK